MAMEKLILDEGHVHAFYRLWVEAMRDAQNSPEKPGDERAAARIVRSWLPKTENVSIAEHDISPTGTRPNIIVTYRSPGLERTDAGILFAGVHMDCVPVASEDQLHYRTEDGMVIGRGVFDNGSNVGSCLALLNYFAREKPEFSRPITFAFTSDEEASETHFGFEGLVKEGKVKTGDYAAAVFADVPWGAWNTMGVETWKLEVEIAGGSGHSGINLSAGNIAAGFYSHLQRVLHWEFGETDPYTRSSIMQLNVMETVEASKQGLTKTLPWVVMKGDLRTHPLHSLSGIKRRLEEEANGYVEGLKTNPQTKAYWSKIRVKFELGNENSDGYVMPAELIPLAERVVNAGFEAADVIGYDPIQVVGGGLPGLREFSDSGILTIATGAAGRPSLENLAYYHAPNEAVHIDDVRRGPAYLFGVAKQLDRELLDMGR